jgi:hypothetical protein
MSSWTYLAAITCLALLTTPANSDVIHVDVAGGGEYLTVFEGVDAASPGDTIVVAPGTYVGTSNRGIHVSGVTLMSEGGPEVTIIDCDNADCAFQVAGSVLDGFTITRAEGSTANGYAAVYAHSATICNCEFAENPGVGLLTYGYNLVTDCVFLDHGSISALIEPGGQTVLSGCIFENRIGSGLSFFNEWYGDGHPAHEVLGCVFRRMGGRALGAFCEDPVVDRCLFVDNNGPALWLDYSSASISNCTIVSNHSVSYGAFNFALNGHHSAENNCTITNCIVAFNSCAGSVSGAPDYSIFGENCFFENAGGDSLLGRGANRSNIFEDPLVCDLAGGDYTLCENSPCLAENEPIGVTIGAYTDAPGCGPCDTPVDVTSWGALKALFRASR